MMNRITILASALMFGASPALAADWTRHVIGDPGVRPDNPNKTANPDGIRLADVNGEGWLDATVGFEFGGYTKVYFHPGQANVTDLWNDITVHDASDSPEDANFMDVNNDGRLDVVTSSESGDAFVSYAPTTGDITDASLWTQGQLAGNWPTSGPEKHFNTRGIGMWAEQADIDGDGHLDVLAGGKGTLGWIEAPDNDADKSNGDTWRYQNIRSSIGWTMSMYVDDLNRDGNPDFLLTDRGAEGGISVSWLENPGAFTYTGSKEPDWVQHPLRGQADARFAEYVDFDGDGLRDLIVAFDDDESNGTEVRWYKQGWDGADVTFTEHTILIALQPGGLHGLTTGDIDNDGMIEIITSASGKPLLIIDSDQHPLDPNVAWTETIILNDNFGKHDTYRLYDVDGDGDLDIFTTSENLYGPIWLENPLVNVPEPTTLHLVAALGGRALLRKRRS